MPVEIRELVIRATVTEPSGRSEVSQDTGLSREVIQKVVDQVLEALKQKKER